MRNAFTLIFLALTGSFVTAAEPDTAWVQDSNRHAQAVLKVQAKYSPEYAGRLGLDGFDEAVMDLRPDLFERKQADTRKVIEQLQASLAQEEHPKVKQDLQILIRTLQDRIASRELERRLLLPYFLVSESVFQGIQSLLDDNVDKSRHPAAVVRLRKYAGLESGVEPATDLAKALISERFGVDGLIGPYRVELRKDLANSQRYVEGIAELMRKHEMEGWEEAHEAFAAQVKEYDEWLEAEMVPRARDSHLLPAELYADGLKNYGVNMEPRELMERAQFGYRQIRSEMQAMARRLAADRKWEEDGFHEVIRAFKKQQLDQDSILDVYRERLADVEDIIRSKGLVTLPEREARIRFASAAESARIPAPSMRPPRLIGNTGEFGEFLIPLRNPNADSDAKMDDFLHDAITWALTAHEARPGHEMQFSAMIENGVSIPRAVFAFNSANVEGWGMYAEGIMQPYLPLEGQFFTLYTRLMRAARAFLDPMLNLGELQPEQAKAFLMQELLLSEPMATQEVDRYTFRMPGQATSYYYGLMKLEALRTRTELMLPGRFDQRAFHDFILSRGLLPVELLEKAMLEEFIPAQQ